jgi:hypothetical protein
MKFKEAFELKFNMKKLFYDRTSFHIELVKKYLKKIIDLNDSRICNTILYYEIENHDKSKYVEPEIEGYIHINYKYYLKAKGETYKPDREIEQKMKIASLHHIRVNKHHAEYWDEDFNINTTKINAMDMPYSYIACMVADWFAIDEELGGNTLEWFEKYKKKCDFTQEQIDLIYDIIKKTKI